MIHRQDTVSLFGVPVSSSIDIEDSEAVLSAIRLTPPDQPIDFILHTPGGLVLAAEQIAYALVEHRGRVTVFVPDYAMDGDTLLALTADEIVIDPHAVLGPVDPQIGDIPAASIVKLPELKRPSQISDETPVLADIVQRCHRRSVSSLSFVRGLALLATVWAVATSVACAQTRQTLSIRGHRQTLYLCVPPTGDPVIVSSGDGGWIHLAPHVAELLRANGYFVVGFDVRGYLTSFTSGNTTLRPQDEPGDYRVLA